MKRLKWWLCEMAGGHHWITWVDGLGVRTDACHRCGFTVCVGGPSTIVIEP